MSLDCKLVPAQPWEYEYGIFEHVGKSYLDIITAVTRGNFT